MGETQIHSHWRFNHQFLGGLDEKQNKIQREGRFRMRDPRVRSGSASPFPLAHFDLQGMSVHNDRKYVLLSFPSASSSASHSYPVNMSEQLKLGRSTSAPGRDTSRWRIGAYGPLRMPQVLFASLLCTGLYFKEQRVSHFHT